MPSELTGTMTFPALLLLQPGGAVATHGGPVAFDLWGHGTSTLLGEVGSHQFAGGERRRERLRRDEQGDKPRSTNGEADMPNRPTSGKPSVPATPRLAEAMTRQQSTQEAA